VAIDNTALSNTI